MPDREKTAPGAVQEARAGFIPLLDCAPLVVARELGFDRQCGFSLRLHREVSWANIRDKVDVGAFDCAQMLAPMPLATALGLCRATQPVVAPLSLNLKGNAITLSSRLFSEMLEADSASAGGGGMAAAKAVAQVVKRRRSLGREPLTWCSAAQRRNLPPAATPGSRSRSFTAFYMSARTFADMLPGLIAAGLDPATPALAVSAATTPRGAHVYATAQDLGEVGSDPNRRPTERTRARHGV